MSENQNPQGQQQNQTNVVFLDGTITNGIATGNNAAWRCRCGRHLIGRTGDRARQWPGRRVQCHDCGRSYFVVPQDHDQGAVDHVEEMADQG